MSLDPLAADYAAWSAYNYVLGNPVMLVDPNGKWPEPPKWIKKAVGNTVAYVAGAVNAIASNLTGNFPGTRGNPNDFGEYAEAAAYGQTAGDVFSIGIGVVEMVGSAVGLVGESGAAPLSGGASVLAIPATAALGIHGKVTVSTAIDNLLSDDGVVQMNDDPENMPYKEKMNKGAGKNRPGNNQVQNKQFKELTKNLNDKQKEQLHREIKELDLDYQELEKHIKQNYND